MARISIRRKVAVVTLGVALLCGSGAAQASAPSGAAAPHRVTPPKLPAVCPNAGLEPTAANLVAVDRATICLINKQRVARGLVALAENSRLDRAATQHTKSMVANNFFSDIGPGSSTVERRTLAAGYARAGTRFRVGENVAIGSVGADTPAQTVGFWMNQPAHRAVLLRAFYRETGVGVVAALPPRFLSGRPGATYTQVFGEIG